MHVLHARHDLLTCARVSGPIRQRPRTVRHTHGTKTVPWLPAARSGQCKAQSEERFFGRKVPLRMTARRFYHMVLNRWVHDTELCHIPTAQKPCRGYRSCRGRLTQKRRVSDPLRKPKGPIRRLAVPGAAPDKAARRAAPTGAGETRNPLCCRSDVCCHSDASFAGTRPKRFLPRYALRKIRDQSAAVVREVFRCAGLDGMASAPRAPGNILSEVNSTADETPRIAFQAFTQCFAK